MEPFEARHMAGMIALHGNYEAMARTQYGRESEDQARSTLTKYLQTWAQENWGTWVIRKGPEGEIIGECGLRKKCGPQPVSLRFVLLKSFRGKGLATLCAQKILTHSFQNSRLESIIGVTRKNNPASRKVMEKIGMKFIRETTEEGQDLLIFRCTSKQWLEDNPL